MTARNTLILLLQNLGFVINLKKSILHPVKQLEFLGLQINTEETIMSLRRKIDSDNSAMPGDLPSTQNFNVTLNKVNWSTFVNCQSYIARENSFSFSPTGANIKSEKAGSYQEYVIFGNLARQKLIWWIENIRLSNGRRIQQQEPQITKRMLPRKSGEHIAKESQQGGNGLNVLELMAVKFAILTFTKNLSILTIHIQMDKKVTLSYLLKMEGTHTVWSF